MNRIIIIVLVLIATMSCMARGQLSSLPSLNDSDEVAELVIFSRGNFNLLLDDQPFVAIRVGDYVRIKVNPGPHVVSAQMRNAPLNKVNEHRSDLKITAVPNLPTHVMAKAIFSYPYTQIYEINAYAAGKFMKKYTRIEIDQ